MKPFEVLDAARAGGVYRCLNCSAAHPRRRGAGSLNVHLAASPRCSVAVLAFRKSLNVDCLDNPPYTPSVMEQFEDAGG